VLIGKARPGSKQPLLQATVDHLQPRSRGGGNGAKNRVLCCYQCNQAKGNIPPEEFKRLIGWEKRP
jgi:5-methylcytosine-specific restriction endonuclease McrA